MVEAKYKYLYGPIFSWRLGVSLGVDPLSQKGKVCNFDCVYCQLGKTVDLENERKVFVPTESLIKEIMSLPELKIDYFTFSGRGEPTLAKNLGEMILALKKLGKGKIAVITNSSLLYLRDVREGLLNADFVLAKLDVCSDETFSNIHRTMQGERFRYVVDGIKDFRLYFRGKLALQIMFMKENKKFAPKIAEIARNINPDEVELNTPLRPSPIKPLSPKELARLKLNFHGLKTITVYDVQKEEIAPFNTDDTIQRHGYFKDIAEELL